MFFRKKKHPAQLKRKNSKNKIEREKKKRSFSIKSLFYDLPDVNLIALVILMLIGGLLMIFSASALIAYSDHSGDTFYYFKRQLVWITIGTFAAFIFYSISLDLLRKFSAPMLATSIVLLLYIIPEALFGYTDSDGITSGIQMPFVAALNGATRWINIGGFSIQPTELVKFSLILYLAAWLTKEQKLDKKNLSKDHFNKVLLPFTLLVGFISLLILAQRDFDSTVILFLSIMVVYYMSGNEKIHTLGAGILFMVSAFFGSIALILEPYRRSRVITFIDIVIHGEPTGDNALAGSFQVWNGLVALGSGGIFGLGYGESRQKLGFLQDAAFTDSIFVIIGEEFGLIGSLIVMLGFLYFTSIGFRIAQKAPNKFSTLLAIGMTSWISIQAFLNIAANLSIIPFGGMPLPFFSYGGSSTIITLMSIGVLLNVSRQKKEKKNTTIRR